MKTTIQKSETQKVCHKSMLFQIGMIFKMLGLSYIELMRKNSAYVQNTDFLKQNI